MGEVVRERGFWNRVPRTQTGAPGTELVARVSLDALTSAVVNANNHLVRCQGETHKAEIALADAQKIWASEILERGQELGIAEFCAIKTKTRHRIEED